MEVFQILLIDLYQFKIKSLRGTINAIATMILLEQNRRLIQRDSKPGSLRTEAASAYLWNYLRCGQALRSEHDLKKIIITVSIRRIRLA